MLSLAVASLFVIAQSPELPTMEQVRKGMYEDMRKLERYQDEWTFMVKAPEETKLTFTRSIDLKRNRLAVLLEGNPMLESGFDGKNDWVVSHAARIYADEPPTEERKPPATFGPPATAEEGSFSFSFDGAYDFSIFSKPDLKVTSLEKVKLDDKEVRKISATSNRPTGKIDVQLWFDLDRWRLLKAHAIGGKTGEPPLEATMTMVKSSFDHKYDDASFTLEQSKVAGYTKKTFAELKGGRP